MDDEEKARLARQGLEAAELLEPGKIRERIGESVSEKARGAALSGLAAIGRLTGAEERSPGRARAAEAVHVNRALDELDAQTTESFEVRLKEAAARRAEQDEAAKMHLANLRRSFPEPARELALLVFNCVDLLDELSDDAEGQPPMPAEELARKEQLLMRIAKLLAPRADEALMSFVEHVVTVSRSYRRDREDR